MKIIETLKTSIFSFIIINLVSKGILLLMAYLQIALRKNPFIDLLAEHFKKNHENANSINFQFHNIKLN